MKSKACLRMGYLSLMLGAGRASSMDRKESKRSRPRLKGGLQVGVEGGEAAASSGSGGTPSSGLLWGAPASSACGESGALFRFVSGSAAGKAEPAAAQGGVASEAWKSASTMELVRWRFSLWLRLQSSGLSASWPSALARAGKKFSNRRLFWMHCWAEKKERKRPPGPC